MKTEQTVQGNLGVTGKKRLIELSFMNVIFTVMVIFVHIFSESVTGLDRGSLQYFIIFAPWKLFQFVVQGFVFLSGVKLFIKDRSCDGIGGFYLGRLKRVVLPYVIWVVIYYAYFALVGWINTDVGEFFHYLITGDISAQFYFVIIICQMYLITPVISKLLKKTDSFTPVIYSLFISLMLGQYMPQLVALFEPEYYFAYNDRLFTTYLFYFVAGAVVGKNYEKVKKALLSAKISVFVMFGVFAAANLTLSYLTSSGRIYIGWLETLHFAYSVSAVLAFFTAFAWVADKCADTPKAVKALDSSSYMLYLSHVLVLFIVRRHLDRFGVNDIGVRLLVSTALMAVFVLVSVPVWETLKKAIKSKARI